LLTLGEVGLPYRIAPEDLGTMGAFDFGGALQTAMTAHPKVDAVTGEMLMFGYDFSPPYLTYHRVDAAGTLVQSEAIDIPASSMMHDFQVTATRVVFMDLPILFDLQMAVQNVFPFRWDDGHGARFGVMPRNGTAADVRWISIDECFIFHTMNAYDDPDDENVVVLEAARHERLWVDGPNDFESRPVLWRYRIHLDTDTVEASPLDDRLIEFPQLDRRLVGRKNGVGYGLWLKEPTGASRPPGVRGILRYELESGSATVHELGEHEQADEAIFVPASADASEGDGYLMSYVYDARNDRTSLVIVDASHVESAPIAKINLPFRVPFGFHGVWVPA
jgi:carotenoid cleavage dioxygenase